MKMKSFKKFLILIFIFTFVFSIVNLGKIYAENEIFTLINASIDEKSDETESTINSFTKNNVVVNTVYHKLNGYVVYKLTIKNNSDKEYTLKSINDNSSNSYIKYEYEKEPNEKISPGKEKNILLKAKYINELSNISNREQNNISLSLTFVDENNKEVTTNIGVTKTGDKILIFILLSLSSVIGIILLLCQKKKKVILPLLILLLPFIVNASDSKFSINFENSNIKIFDKIQVRFVDFEDNMDNLIDYDTKIAEPEEPDHDEYTFRGWFVGDEEFDFDNDILDDLEITAKYDLINYTIGYTLNGGTVDGENPEEYTVEANSFTLINPTKAGYNFAGWTGSNGDVYQTRVTIDQGSIGNRNYIANFLARDDTPYQVIHRYKSLDGTTYEEEIEDLTGVTGTTISP